MTGTGKKREYGSCGQAKTDSQGVSSVQTVCDICRLLKTWLSSHLTCVSLNVSVAQVVMGTDLGVDNLLRVPDRTERILAQLVGGDIHLRVSHLLGQIGIAWEE